MNASIIVIAKAPVAGRVKTRLCPPCSPRQAAALATAALADTLDVVTAVPAARRVLALDGEPGPWLVPGFDVVPQPGGGLGNRLTAAFAAVSGPAFLVGMDTPHLTPELLTHAITTLTGTTLTGTTLTGTTLTGRAGRAVLGPARDGGWWGIGLPHADPLAFPGIPMSAADTGGRQRERLHALGYDVRDLPELRDVDTFGDARLAALAAPGSQFARAFAEVEHALEAMPVAR